MRDYWPPIIRSAPTRHGQWDYWVRMFYDEPRRLWLCILHNHEEWLERIAQYEKSEA